MKISTIVNMLRLAALELMMFVLVTACKSSSHIDNPNTTNKDNGVTTYIHKVIANAVGTQALTAKMKVNLSIGDKNIGLSGNLRMKRGEVIQLSMTFPIVGEVCRMEFTPEDVLVIDRINTRYVRAAYDQVDFLRTANLDYYVLESIFWNEVFYPGSRSVGEHLSEYSISAAGGHTLLSLNSAPKLDYAFLTLTDGALLDRITISSKNISDSSNLVCAYDDFAKFEGGRFPTQIKLTFAGDSRTYGLDVSLNSLASNSDWKSRTEVSAKYERIDAEKLFKNLIP